MSEDTECGTRHQPAEKASFVLIPLSSVFIITSLQCIGGSDCFGDEVHVCMYDVHGELVK